MNITSQDASILEIIYYSLFRNESFWWINIKSKRAARRLRNKYSKEFIRSLKRR